MKNLKKLFLSLSNEEKSEIPINDLTKSLYRSKYTKTIGSKFAIKSGIIFFF